MKANLVRDDLAALLSEVEAALEEEAQASVAGACSAWTSPAHHFPPIACNLLPCLKKFYGSPLTHHARVFTQQTGKGAVAGRMHQVWAVRSNVDPFLDLARANFNKLTGER